MDTGSDFIQPEFLNILFFQQKNLVVFPYVDLKHLHALELFTVGHNIVDLDSTALHNLAEILEFESSNNYSQNPTRYFVYSLDEKRVKEILEIKGVRCVLNCKDSIPHLANGANFIFYNKKSKKFINYDSEASDLDFESHLISSSKNEMILQDRIQGIKMAATRVFTDFNQDGNLDNLAEILGDFKPQYWPKILKFTEIFFGIQLPDIENASNKPASSVKAEESFKQVPIKVLGSDKGAISSLEEYGFIMKKEMLAKEFIQLLHDYRVKHVNAANLDLEVLFSPVRLYSYLRKHHWKDGISKDFISSWIQMPHTGHALGEDDIDDLEEIFKQLNIPDEYTSQLMDSLDLEPTQGTKAHSGNGESHEFKPPSDLNIPMISQDSKELKQARNEVPPVKNFTEFQDWIRDKLTKIEDLLL